jgi:hypothetical protein
MRPTVSFVLSGLILAALAGDAVAQLDPSQKPAVIAKIRPKITSVTHWWSGGAASIILDVRGTALPANQTTKQRLFRLRAPALSGGEDVYYTGQPSQIFEWTSTHAQCWLPYFPVARTFTIGVGEKAISSPDSTFVLLSNEVQYFIPIEIAETTPHPIPLGTSEIVARTRSPLGPRNGRVVKVGGKIVTVTTWNPDEWNFAFLRPTGLAFPGMYELWVESPGGLVISTKLRVRFLGPNVH